MCVGGALCGVDACDSVCDACMGDSIGEIVGGWKFLVFVPGRGLDVCAILREVKERPPAFGRQGLCRYPVASGGGIGGRM